MCHGFLATKDSGERLSHAVGCAFAVCLERKQRRDKECGVTMTFDMKNSTFTRTGSFRQPSLTERLANNERGIDVITGAPSAIVAPQPKPFNPFAKERPHATPTMLERQGSFRGFNQIGGNSPFKRQMSLRINDLPSNAERQRAFLEPILANQRSVSPIPENVPVQTDSVSQLCQELSQGLSLLTKNDEDLNFNNQSSINQNTAILLNSPITSPTGLSKITSTSLYQSQSNSGLDSTEMAVITTSTTSATMSVFPSSINNTTSYSIPISQVSPTRHEIITSPSSIVVPTSPQKVIPIETVAPLPNPDQWLGQIVKSTSPSPRRPPSLGLHSRAKSLNSDPFDAEWASNAVKPENRSTNPFISPPKPPAQSFQVQL